MNEWMKRGWMPSSDLLFFHRAYNRKLYPIIFNLRLIYWRKPQLYCQPSQSSCQCLLAVIMLRFNTKHYWKSVVLFRGFGCLFGRWLGNGGFFMNWKPIWWTFATRRRFRGCITSILNLKVFHASIRYIKGVSSPKSSMGHIPGSKFRTAGANTYCVAVWNLKRIGYHCHVAPFVGKS